MLPYQKDASRTSHIANINIVKEVIAGYPPEHPIHAVMRSHLGNNRRRGTRTRYSTGLHSTNYVGPAASPLTGFAAVALGANVVRGMPTEDYYEELQANDSSDLFYMAVACVCVCL